MEYLTPQQVLFIHYRLIAATGLLWRRNGFALTAYAFTMVMATGEAGQAEARVWLTARARREKATVARRSPATSGTPSVRRWSP